MSKERNILVIGIAAIMLFSVLGAVVLAVSSESINSNGSNVHTNSTSPITYIEKLQSVDDTETGIIDDSKEDETSEPEIDEPTDEAQSEETDTESVQPEEEIQGQEPLPEEDEVKDEGETTILKPLPDLEYDIEYETIDDLFD